MYKGPVPFSLDWDKEDVSKLGELDAPAVHYMRFISGTIRPRCMLCTPGFKQYIIRLTGKGNGFRHLRAKAEKGVYDDE